MPQRAARLRRRLLTRLNALALLAAFAAAGCGSTSTLPPSRAQTIALHWHEAPGPPGRRLIVGVNQLVVRPNDWSVSATVENDTGVTFSVGRPHHPGETEFGVLVLSSATVDAVRTAGPGVYAARYSPPVPRYLHPHEAWSGTFSGSGRLEPGRYVRVELGRFTAARPAKSGLPWRFGVVTDHVRRLPRR